MSLGDVSKVWEIKALKRKPKAEEATKILQSIAKQVQPIMRKHNWRVKLLSEFCPKNAALLGLNVGAGIHVKLRLRRANRDEEFLPFNQILDTMLHELCHNAHGPHNASFYKLWDEIRKECEDLISKGISGTGEGFDLPGKRLGGSFPQPPLSSLRKTALAAAEKRANLKKLLPSGPMRLGGDSAIMSALSPSQAAAMAAERRLRDNIWCGSEFGDSLEEDETTDQKPADKGHSSGKSKIDCGSDAQNWNGMSRKRTRCPDKISLINSGNGDTGSEFIDLTAGPTISESMVNGDEIFPKKISQTSGSSQCSSNIHKEMVQLSSDSLTSEIVCPHDATRDAENSSMWECSKCTLLNLPLAPICELCSTQKPKDVDSIRSTWPCKFCTLDNSVKLETCTACGSWRYSHGPPVATSAYLGT